MRLSFCALAAIFLAGCAQAPRPPAPAPAPAADLSIFNPVLSTEDWSFAGARGRIITTPSYRIYTTEESMLLRGRIALFMESAMRHYTSALATLDRPNRQVETYIMASRSQWAQLTRQLTGPRADVYLKIRAGGFAEGGRALLFDIGARTTFATAAHEGWHQYTQCVLRNILPTCFEEGIATYMEGFRWDSEDQGRPIFLGWANVERFDRLRDAAQGGRLTPLTQLLLDRPQDLLDLHDNDRALDYYAQVWALIHFLREGAGGKYRAGLQALLEDAQAGAVAARVRTRLGPDAAAAYAFRRAGIEVFQTYITADLETASREFDQFIQRLRRTGARDAIVAGRSPLRE